MQNNAQPLPSLLTPKSHPSSSATAGKRRQNRDSCRTILPRCMLFLPSFYLTNSPASFNFSLSASLEMGPENTCLSWIARLSL